MHGGLHATELYFAWEAPGVGERVRLDDRFVARSFLARLHARGDGLALRRLAASQLAGARLDDAELLDQLAGWIASGRIRIAVSSKIPLSTTGDEEAIAPAPELPWDAPSPMEPVALVEEAMPPASTDMQLQAQALREAAREGVPFCEECEKLKKAKEADEAARLDQAAQAATLRRAAETGTPFCAECEKLAAEKKS
jgi:hypothetical protein